MLLVVVGDVSMGAVSGAEPSTSLTTCLGV